MKYEELPEIPRIWIDFVTGSLSRFSLKPALCDLQALRARAKNVGNQEYRRENLSRLLTDGAESNAARTLEKIYRLRQPETVVVVTKVQASLFGGPAFHLLKCLTAIRVCEELAKHAIAAVPVCWISSAPSGDSSEWAVSLLDHEGELHQFGLHPERADISTADPLPVKPTADLLAKIEDLGHGVFDPEIIKILRAACVPGATLSSAVAQLLSVLMGEWGLIVLDPQAPGIKPLLAETATILRDRADKIDSLFREQRARLAEAGYFEPSPGAFFPDFLEQSSILPVIAAVIDPNEIHPFIKSLPVLDELGFPRPIGWPQSSATIVDARSRRTLEKYHLGISELFSGEEEMTRKIKHSMPHSALEKLDGLVSEVEWRMAELGAHAPAGDEFLMTRDSCKKKIIYQIERLKDRYEAAGQKREQAMNRQIRKARSSLAPGGRAQERGLSGIHFLLRYSRAVLRFLYEKMDILNFEHQLISMD